MVNISLTVILSEAAPNPVYARPAERAGAALRRDALPGRLHERGAEPAAGTVRGQSPGEDMHPATASPLRDCFCFVIIFLQEPAVCLERLRSVCDTVPGVLEVNCISS